MNANDGRAAGVRDLQLKRAVIADNSRCTNKTIHADNPSVFPQEQGHDMDKRTSAASPLRTVPDEAYAARRAAPAGFR